LTYGHAPVTDATTVHVRNGETQTTQGPLAETDEQLGRYFMLDCENLDEAIGWAAKISHATYGSIEIRPVIAYCGGYLRNPHRTQRPEHALLHFLCLQNGL
jgi:hypothetical protein